MPSLISVTERQILTGIFNDIFDTFQRTIVVYKEPIKTRVNPNPANMLYGFGESQQDDAFSYTEVTGVYPAVIRYPPTQPVDQNTEIDAMISAGEVSIKVKRDCRDFINSGKTEKIVFDSRTFTLDGDERKQTFLESEFFVFKLRATK